MLTAPNHSGVVAVSLNPSVVTPAVTQPAMSSTQAFQSTLILPPGVQQGSLPQIISGGQIVNLTPVKANDHIITSPASSKTHSCSFCHKYFSSRYNVTRHEKICKLNVNSTAVNQVRFSSNENKHFFCLTCQKVFATEESLTKHQKKCKGVTPVPTTQSFVQLSSSGRKVHLCKFCGKEFSTKWNVIRHERLFHDPNDPVIIPPAVANGTGHTVPAVNPPGKPERYCRFCGNYFSSKYNAIRHEKICTRVGDTSTNSLKQNEQGQPISAPSDQPQLPQQAQQQTPVKANQMTVVPVTPQAPTPMIMSEQHQGNPQQEQQRLQQQIVQQQLTQQASTQMQNTQQQHVVTQQAMLVIEQPNPPFHVCKFCNKQLSTRCDPGSHNIISNMPTVATITGQPMQIGSSGGQLTGLVTPVMASLPQVTLVQPQLSNIQGHTLQQTVHLQQGKGRMQPHEQHAQPPQQQITLQHIRLQPQQVQTVGSQIQLATVQHQQNTSTAPVVERPYSCKYCDKHFATKWYLDQHEKIHTGEADMCKECGKYFVTRWHLEKHMRVHLGGSGAAKKMKKEEETSANDSAVLSTNNSLPDDVIGFQTEVICSDGEEPAPFFDPNTSGAMTSQGTIATTASDGQVVASNSTEEHSTIDKSQIESTLSMSYS